VGADLKVAVNLDGDNVGIATALCLTSWSAGRMTLWQVVITIAQYWVFWDGEDVRVSDENARAIAVALCRYFAQNPFAYTSLGQGDKIRMDT
jgi:hypothetical protein